MSFAQSLVSVQRRAGRALALGGLVLSAFSQADVVGPGWGTTSIPHPAPFAASCTLPGGELITFDGQFVDRWSADGTQYLGTLASLPTQNFPSFVKLSPSGSFLVLGDTVLSGNGTLYRLDLAGPTLTALLGVPLNYDAAFEPSGQVLVSASTTGLNNDLLRIDPFTAQVTLVGQFIGPSGPLAVAPNGDLYYATQQYAFPPPPASTSVLHWTAAQVAAGALIENNAATVFAGFDGGSSLAFDPIGGRVYLAETNFGTGVNRIREVHSGSSPVAVDAGAYLNSLEILVGSYPASLAAYQPATGVNLRYQRGGLELVRLAPVRPVLSVFGPGLNGPGPVNFQLSGGPPAGLFQVTACPQFALSPTEAPIQLPDFLLHTTFDLSLTRRVLTPFPLDASGAGAFSIFNPGTLQGQWAFQFFVGTPQSFVGSSNVVQF